MRRKDKEITDKKFIEEILSKAEICRIAMVDNGEPYLVPVNYGYFENTIYFHSASKGRKIDILKRNNRICLEIDYGHEVLKKELACKWTAKYRSLIGFGTVDFIMDEQEKLFALDKIMAHYGSPGNNIYNMKTVENVTVLKVNLEEFSMKQSGTWE